MISRNRVCHETSGSNAVLFTLSTTEKFLDSKILLSISVAKDCVIFEGLWRGRGGSRLEMV